MIIVQDILLQKTSSKHRHHYHRHWQRNRPGNGIDNIANFSSSYSNSSPWAVQVKFSTIIVTIDKTSDQQTRERTFFHISQSLGSFIFSQYKILGICTYNKWRLGYLGKLTIGDMVQTPRPKQQVPRTNDRSTNWIYESRHL